MSDRPRCRLEPQCPNLVSSRAALSQASAMGTSIRLPVTTPLTPEAPYCEWHIREGLTVEQAAICDEEECGGPPELPHWVLCPACGATMTERDRLYLVGTRLALTPPPAPKPGEFDHGPYRYRCWCQESEPDPFEF